MDYHGFRVYYAGKHAVQVLDLPETSSRPVRIAERRDTTLG